MAFEISTIHEIVKVPEIKTSSIQNEIFMGIINLRGRTIPIVSFAKVLKMKDAALDQDKKFKVPTLVTQKIQNQFQNDIKEIVSVSVGEKESALIILNIDSVSERVRSFKAVA